jgi:hypothetical protein
MLPIGLLACRFGRELAAACTLRAMNVSVGLHSCTFNRGLIERAAPRS